MVVLCGAAMLFTAVLVLRFFLPKEDLTFGNPTVPESILCFVALVVGWKVGLSIFQLFYVILEEHRNSPTQMIQTQERQRQQITDWLGMDVTRLEAQKIRRSCK